MGEKKKKLIYDFTCCYCGKKSNIELLTEQGYTVETKLGLVVSCPNTKCEAEQLI